MGIPIWVWCLLYTSPLFSKFPRVQLLEFCNCSIYLYRIKKKIFHKFTCLTGSFTCPGPSRKVGNSEPCYIKIMPLCRLGQTLKMKSCHDANFVPTGGTGGCYYDNLRCHQWQQSWHHHGSYFSGWIVKKKHPFSTSILLFIQYDLL